MYVCVCVHKKEMGAYDFGLTDFTDFTDFTGYICAHEK